MTQLRKHRCPHCHAPLDPISNYFDDLLRGIGHRGSSFTDVDAVTHDEVTDRYLFQEFKGAGEPLNTGQARYLKGLARKNYVTVWCVRRRSDGNLDWCDVATRTAQVITELEYRERFRCWWSNLTTARKALRDLTDAELDAEIVARDQRLGIAR